MPRVITLSSPAGQVTLVLALELLALGASMLVYRFFPARLGVTLAARVRTLDERGVASVIAVSLAAVYLLAWLTTPQINFGEGALGTGYGADGAIYGRMTERFAWFKEPGIGYHYHRILAPALVHYSGLDTFTGFHLLNAVSFVLGSVLMYASARRLGFSRYASLLALYLFAMLKFGIKFWLYYPVLTDGLGTLLMMAIIYATVSRRDVLYVVSMSAAVFCRENLLALVFFNLLHHRRSDGWRLRYGSAAVLHGIPIVLFILSRTFPVFIPLTPSGAFPYVLDFAWRFVSQPARQGVVLMGYMNSLGVVVLLAVFRWRHVVGFLATRPEWLYYFVASLVMSIALGVDVDRFAVWLAPVLILAALEPEPKVEASSVRLAVYLLLVHAASMELFLPWYPDRDFYRGLHAPYASAEAYAAMTVAVCALVTCVVGRLGERRADTRPL